MPIDPDRAVGASLSDVRFGWTSSDVLLYHLALGVGSRPGDQTDPRALRWTLDGARLQVLPSFGVVAPHLHDTHPPGLDLPGCDIDLARVLHGGQEIDVPAPLPTHGEATLRTRISDVWDKGSAAVIVQEAEAVGDDGTALFSTRSSIFVRGEGGWGGDRGPSSRVELPERTADVDTTCATAPNQALLYRLCGDRNPLHADPAFAREAGFPAPILHGLCSYGIVLRTVVDAVLGGDVAEVRGFAARFAGVVFPGETIRVRAWDEGAQVLVQATIGSHPGSPGDQTDRDGAPVLGDCVLTRA
jgi:acyl dehydratase